jgi:hypothetical protein
LDIVKGNKFRVEFGPIRDVRLEPGELAIRRIIHYQA